MQRSIWCGFMTAENTFDLRHEDPTMVRCSGNEVVSLPRKVKTDIWPWNTWINAQEAVWSEEKPDLVTHTNTLSAQNNINGRPITAPSNFATPIEPRRPAVNRV